jgi:TRAP-type mannitol/chloroaromatic compound transport system permease large subunit
MFILKGSIDDEKATLGMLFQGVWPFVWATLLLLILLMLLPSIVTFLPALAF